MDLGGKTLGPYHIVREIGWGLRPGAAGAGCRRAAAPRPASRVATAGALVLEMVVFLALLAGGVIISVQPTPTVESRRTFTPVAAITRVLATPGPPTTIPTLVPT